MQKTPTLGLVGNLLEFSGSHPDWSGLWNRIPLGVLLMRSHPWSALVLLSNFLTLLCSSAPTGSLSDSSKTEPPSQLNQPLASPKATCGAAVGAKCFGSLGGFGLGQLPRKSGRHPDGENVRDSTFFFFILLFGVIVLSFEKSLCLFGVILCWLLVLAKECFWENEVLSLC